MVGWQGGSGWLPDLTLSQSSLGASPAGGKAGARKTLFDLLKKFFFFFFELALFLLVLRLTFDIWIS
jgi:hypothetical protein